MDDGLIVNALRFLNKGEKQMFTKDDLIALGKEKLMATAMEHGIKPFPNWKEETIARKILEKLAKQPLPEREEEAPKKTEKKEFKSSEKKEELAEFFNSVIERGAEVDKEGDVVTVVFRGRRTCINVNQPLIAIKRAIDVFMVS